MGFNVGLQDELGRRIDGVDDPLGLLRFGRSVSEPRSSGGNMRVWQSAICIALKVLMAIPQRISRHPTHIDDPRWFFAPVSSEVCFLRFQV